MMKKFFTALIVVYSVLLGAACDKTKTLNEMDRLSTEFRLYGNKIAKANNDAFEANSITRGLHGRVNTAAEVYLKGVTAADKAIAAARTVTGDELKSSLDYIDRLLNIEVWGSFVDIVDAVAEVPPELKQQLDVWIAAIKALFATARGLFSQVQGPVMREVTGG